MLTGSEQDRLAIMGMGQMVKRGVQYLCEGRVMQIAFAREQIGKCIALPCCTAVLLIQAVLP